MTLKSMTGFARADGVHGDTSWHWEARSVNGRNLDLRLRLPSGFDGARDQGAERSPKRSSRAAIAPSTFG